MKRPRYDHPGCPEAGRVYIHDDAAWLAGQRDTLRVSWIHIEPNGWFSVLSSYPEHAPAKMAALKEGITEARKSLKLEAKRIQRRADNSPQEN